MERLLLPLVLSVGSWLISWFVMWVLHEAAAKSKFYIEDVIPNMGDVITEDGNDLFKTGLMYSVLLLISLLCPWKWVAWVLFALTVAACIPPIGGFIAQTQHPAWKFLPAAAKASRVLCVFVPLATSAVILLFACL